MLEGRKKPAPENFTGFWRRFRITHSAGEVTSALEDDYHQMSVTLEYDGVKANRVRAELNRAPWTTCPGAVDKVVETFTGVVLADFPRRGEKKQNCTHLHDLATLAAAHAGETETLVYDILVSDQVDGLRNACIWSNDDYLMDWVVEGIELVAPEEIKGQDLFGLND